MTTVFRESTRTEAPLSVSPQAEWDVIPMAKTAVHWPLVLQPHADQLAVRVLRMAQAQNLRRIGIAAPRDGQSKRSVVSLLLQGFRHLSGTRVFALDLTQNSFGNSDFLGPENFASTSEEALRLTPTVAVMCPITAALPSITQLTSPLMGTRIDQIDAGLRPDLMLFELPALLDHSDALAAAPLLDALLICVASDETTEQDLLMCRDRFEGILPVMGTVLTESRGLV